MWHSICTYCGQVVLIFPGVVGAFRLVPEWGENGVLLEGARMRAPFVFLACRFEIPGNIICSALRVGAHVDATILKNLA